MLKTTKFQVLNGPIINLFMLKKINSITTKKEGKKEIMAEFYIHRHQ